MPSPRAPVTRPATAAAPIAEPLTLTFVNAHPDRLYTAAEVAGVFRLKVQTVERWCSGGKLAAHKPDGFRGWLIYGHEVIRKWGAAILEAAPVARPTTKDELLKAALGHLKRAEVACAAKRAKK